MLVFSHPSFFMPEAPKRPTSILGRFRALPARQRVIIGVVGMGLSVVGLHFADQAERLGTGLDALQPPRTAAGA